ncbi:MAG: hypothetical protein PQ612_01765 [Rickettsiales bacterium]|nr:hypothetical protein [Pseudomonadota bacterium]MDA0965356.1 hypothetical protein [Pseudomonadota bacterium]MDG4544284.1 hypothetical protein [Rickettsiales bacterium]MDG4544871.1 hypothetical protein [Rickettsiales bacterium]MDG4546993.1 hypothetical protein [Rickettsiales bacterium]
MRNFNILRQHGLYRINSLNKISNNQVLLGSHRSFSGLSSKERDDGIIIDAVGLSSFPDSRAGKLNQLRPKGLYIDAADRGSKEDFSLMTTEGSNYELRTLENVNMRGFHARSYLVFPKEGDSPALLPSSLRIAFGGTKQYSDIPRTTAMFLTGRPMAYEKETKEFLDKTMNKYQEAYGTDKVPRVIVVSAHSAGTPHAIKAYNILKEKGIRSDIQLRLYEPFGAKFTGFEPKEDENIATYVCKSSFLPKMYNAGKTLGHTETLPPPTDEKVANGTFISAAKNAISTPIMAHMLLWIVDSHIDRNATKNITLSDSLESLPSILSRNGSQASLCR